VRTLLGAGAALMLVPAAATAAPADYDCDAAAADVVEIASLDQAGPDYRVRGSIRPVLPRSHPDYVATATVYIRSADRRRLAIVQILRGAANRYTVTARRVTQGHSFAATPALISTGETLSFELASSAAGTYALLAGHRIALGPPIGAAAHLSVTCSTGRFQFGDLDWSPN
jgi:hypothetical protein